ncbi:MAG: VIT1/CCC1 transporter family protein [Proteobacteria bacterium]|nr:VIT1/CCC1 transporter family protein [Candidatus Enterousia scatequi]
MKKRFDNYGAMILGMHDALVSLVGTIAGLTFALTNRRLILLTGIITSVVAALSMTAANYMASKTNNDPMAPRTALYTGFAYMLTSALLLLPFVIFKNLDLAFISTIIVGILIIFGFNAFIGLSRHRPFMRKFIEMLVICTIVSVIALIIGQCAKIFLHIEI